MTRSSSSLFLRLAAGLLACTLAAAPALAEKPDGGGGKHSKHDDGGGKHKHGKHDDGGGKHKDKHGKHDDHGGKHKDKHGKKGGGDDRRDVRVGGYFSDRDRQVARVSFSENYGSGGRACPPGLAKKNNGCMPPGQAKKYNLGQPLPSTVVVYPVPQTILVTLPAPPSGHKYVRVAADILLIAVGTSMVVDAISDLARL